MGKAKVLHSVAGAMPAAGFETFIMNVFRSIDRERVEFHFLYTTDASSFYDEEIKSLGGIIHRIPGLAAWRHPARSEAMVRELCERERFDVLHDHLGLMHTILPLRAALRGGGACEGATRAQHG